MTVYELYISLGQLPADAELLIWDIDHDRWLEPHEPVMSDTLRESESWDDAPEYAAILTVGSL